MIYVRFSIRAKKVCLTAIKRRSTDKRHVCITNQLIAPDLESWRRDEQIFAAPTQNAVDNNNILSKIMEDAQSIIDCYTPSTPQEFVALYKKLQANKPTTILSLGNYLKEQIEIMRLNPGKHKTKHYQNYITLLHKLELEGRIILKPIKDIDNRDFIAFMKWIVFETNGANYLKLGQYFKTIHQRAYETEINDNVLRYKYRDHAPTLKKRVERTTLTLDQYNKLKKLDVGQIRLNGEYPAEHKQLYKDFFILLYETMARPVDVVLFHSDNIITLRGRKCLQYIPQKKKNYRNVEFTAVPLSDLALQIIDKYKGMSAFGYLLPTKATNYKFNLDDTKEWAKWYNKKQSFLAQANSFLKKIAPLIGVDPNNLVNYSLRHSIMTHAAANDKGKPIIQIAKEAGTSVKMLEQHYYDYKQNIGK